MGIWGAFSVAQVRADTYYQQLTDSSGGVEPTSLVCERAGSFTVSSSYSIPDGSRGLVVFVSGSSPPANNFVQIAISTSSSKTGNCTLPGVVAEYASANSPTSANVDYFWDLFSVNAGSYPTPNLIPGVVYYIWTYLGATDSGSHVVTNFSDDFMYGYLTSAGGESVPISPGLPGFTDVGIATTSQQAYCNSNFSTSTGLLDSVGRSISLGICNVGVFLFVPNVSSLNTFSQLSSTTRAKIPFSYYYDFAGIFNGSSASSSSNFTALSVDLRGTGVGSTTPWGNVLPASFVYLSSTTITTYVSQSLYDLLFLLMRSAIWISVLFHIYHRLVPKHATNV